MKIALFGDDNGHNFTFISPTAALGEREKFKSELTTIITRNRKTETPATPTPVVSSASLLPKPSLISSRPSTSRAASTSSDGLRATPIIPGTDPSADFRHRKNVFLQNPDLAALHRELVVGGHISEAEFWEGREVCSLFLIRSSLSNTRTLASHIRSGSSGFATKRQIWCTGGPTNRNSRWRHPIDASAYFRDIWTISCGSESI